MATESPSPPLVSRWRVLAQLLLVVVFIGAGVAVAAFFKSTAPRTQRRPPAPLAPLVEALTLERATYTVTVTAMGEVVPAQEMTLRSRVPGQVVRLDPEFTVGGLLSKDQTLLAVEDSDYQLAVAQAESAVVNSQFALSLEEGRQAVARREWSLLNGKATGADADLALRKPHLDKAKADLAASRAALEKARLDLGRTRIAAPFNAMVRTRAVALGSQVGGQEALATLVGTDRFWVEVSLPVDRLDWFDIPRVAEAGGAAAVVHHGAGHTRPARVVRLRGDLTVEGRMARVLVAVDDPLALKPDNRALAPLLIGEYVRVEIQGRQLDEVISLPREALRDGDRVWLLAADDTLVIRPVTPLWRDAGTVVVAEGLAPGDRLVTSSLSAPVAGMALRTETAAAGRPGEAKGTAAAKEKRS